jgi:PAS domain S-box-containing protein
VPDAHWADLAPPLRAFQRAITGHLAERTAHRGDLTDQPVEERFRLALRGTPVSVYSQDSELRLTWIYNPEHGYTPEAVIGKTDAELFAPEDAAVLTAMKRRVLETGEGAREQVRVTIGGEGAYYDLTVEPLRGPEGDVVGITGAATNITALKKAEEALALERERQARLDGMLFAARQLASRVNDTLARSSGAIDGLQADSGLAPHLRDALEAASALSEAMRKIAELQGLGPAPPTDG